MSENLERGVDSDSAARGQASGSECTEALQLARFEAKIDVLMESTIADPFEVQMGLIQAELFRHAFARHSMVRELWARAGTPVERLEQFEATMKKCLELSREIFRNASSKFVNSQLS